MRYFLLVILISSITTLSSYGQELSHADSVLNELAGFEKTRRIDTLISLAYFPIAKKTKANECLVFAQKAKELALELNLLDKYAKALELEGVALGAQGQFPQAIDSVKKSLEISQSLSNDTLLAEGYFSLGSLFEVSDDMPQAIISYKTAQSKFELLDSHPFRNSVINNLANAYYHSGSYTEALAFYLQSLALNKQSNNENQLAKNYGNLSLVYRSLENYPKANFYVQQAIELQKKLDHQFSLSISYLSAGNIQRKMEQYDSAFYFNTEALKISNTLEDTVGIAFAYFNIASVHYSKKEYAKAIDYFSRSKELFAGQRYRSKVLMCYNNLSICYRELGDNVKALTNAKLGFEIAKELNNLPQLETVTETLYYTYKELGNYKEALSFRDLNVTYKDSLLNQEKVNELAKIETNYEIKSRDNEIALLNKNKEIADIKAKENQRISYFLIVIAVLLLAIIATIYNRYLAQKKIKMKLAEANVQLKELNLSKNKFFAIISHDLRNPISAFNNLTSALVVNFKALTEEQLLNYLVNLKKSSAQIGGLLENLLQWALSQTDTLSVEMKEFDLSKIIQNNIDLLAQNAQQKSISFNFNLPDNVIAYADQSTIDIVFRNIISNAIKFSKAGSNIYINAVVAPADIEIHIVDEGIGMTADEIEMLFDITRDTSQIGSSTEKGSGLGLVLSNEYIKKNNGEISVLSKPDKGSTFIIKLPRTQRSAA